MCGLRLTDNKYFGQNVQQLERELEEAHRELRRAKECIRELELKHAAEMRPAKERDAECAERCRHIQDALDWAARNDIQHPWMR